MGKVIGGDKQAKHAAVKEAQTPVVILINLQEANVLRILLIDLIKIRPAKQLERIHTLGTCRELHSDSGEEHIFPVLVVHLICFQVLSFSKFLQMTNYYYICNVM